MRFIAVGLLALVATGPIVVSDVSGRALSLLAPAEGKTELLFFVNTECPISNRYAPEITRICNDYRSRGVDCVLVYPDASLTPAAVNTHRQDFSLSATGPAVIDRTFALTAAVDATVTPEAVIYAHAGRAYRGRIDNLYVDVGRARPSATSHDLRSALDAVLAGRPVPTPTTEPVGCSIERR